MIEPALSERAGYDEFAQRGCLRRAAFGAGTHVDILVSAISTCDGTGVNQAPAT